jgi:hypothetical protein
MYPNLWACHSQQTNGVKVPIRLGAPRLHTDVKKPGGRIGYAGRAFDAAFVIPALAPGNWHTHVADVCTYSTTRLGITGLSAAADGGSSRMKKIYTVRHWKMATLLRRHAIFITYFPSDMNVDFF